VQETVVSAPGKIILMGEHAAVYGHPALVATIDLRLRVSISSEKEGAVIISLPTLGIECVTDWPTILDDTESCRAEWEACFGPHAYRSAESYASVGAADRLVRVALGETIGLAGVVGLPMRIRIDGDLPAGAGFGSSAAMALGVAGAYLRFAHAPLSDELLQRISMEVERRQHGTPSGVDHNAVLKGGLLWAQREADGQLSLEPLPREASLLRCFRVFHSGTPAESTGTLVAAVRRRIQRARRRFRGVLQSIDSATRELRNLLLGVGDATRVLHLIRQAEAALEDLGVVPEPIRRIIRKIEAAGGAAKISGAGALSGDRGGSILVYHPEPDHIKDWDFLSEWRPLAVTLGSEGLRAEPPLVT
jgi:mevalonate kinase